MESGQQQKTFSSFTSPVPLNEPDLMWVQYNVVAFMKLSKNYVVSLDFGNNLLTSKKGLLLNAMSGPGKVSVVK